MKRVINILFDKYIAKNTGLPDSREKIGVLSGIVGIVCNIVLCILKFIAGALTNSIAVTADAFNSLSDAGSSIVTLVGFRMAGKPVDEKHPFGYGRYEYISGFIASIAIIFMGLELIKSSIEKLASGNEAVQMDMFSLFVLIFSIALKLWMFFFNRKLGRTINSATLKTLSIDSISDVAITLTVLLGLIITHFTGISVDGYSGLLVSAFIIYAGFNTARDTLNPLLGQLPEESLIDTLKKMVLSHPYILGVHNIIVHNYGPSLSIISLHAEVPHNMSVITLHKIIDEIEREVGTELGYKIVIHMDPVSVSGQEIDETSTAVETFLLNISPNIKADHFRSIEGHDCTNIIFDVFLPSECNIDEAELEQNLCAHVESLSEKYKCVLSINMIPGSCEKTDSR